MGLFSSSRHKDVIFVKVISGKKYFDGLLSFSGVLALGVLNDGRVYTIRGKNTGVFQVLNYEWEGSAYESVTVVKDATNSSYDTHGREKRTGRLVGAAVGTAIMPGVGTALGALHGTGNKKSKSRTRGRSNHTGRTTVSDREIASKAYMTLRDDEYGDVFTFGFECDSDVNIEVMNFLHKTDLYDE